MSYINWNLAGGNNNALASFGQGMQLGNYISQKREEKEYKSALANFDPSNPDSIKPIMAIRPEVGIKLQGQVDQRQAQIREGSLVQAAMGDDPDARAQAMSQLATVNFDKWKTLDAQQKAAIALEAERNANAAMDVLNMPPAQWSQAIMGYANEFGDPEIAAIADMPIEQQRAALRAAVAEGGMVKDLQAMERPDYVAVDRTADLVNVRDPQAVQQVAASRRGLAPAQPIPRTVGGKEYYQNPETGEWFDNPQEAMGGSGGNAGGGF